MLIVSALMAFALLGTLKAVTMTRNVTDRGEILTRLMLRAHAEIETRKAAAFDTLEVGTTTLGDFEDPRTTGVLTIARLPDSPGLKVSVDLVTRTPNGVHTIQLSARRFPEAGR
jgi:hypothetical protein